MLGKLLRSQPPNESPTAPPGGPGGRLARRAVALSLSLAAALALTPMPTARASAPSLTLTTGPFRDLLPGYWATSTIDRLAAAGLLLAPSTHLYDPYGAETRGAWAEEVALAIEVTPPPAPQDAPYPDVAPSSVEAPGIAVAAERGWVAFPTDQGFAPDAPITRQEAFSLLGLALYGPEAAAPAAPLPFVDADLVAPWALGPIAALVSHGMVQGTGAGLLDPQGTLSRADAAVLLGRAWNDLLTAGGHRWRIQQVRQLNATAYGNGEGFGGDTASGTPVHVGEAAADLASLPMGTMVWVTGYDANGYLPSTGILEQIQDTGNLGPNDIDLYMSASSPWPYQLFGRQAVQAYILAPNPVA